MKPDSFVIIGIVLILHGQPWSMSMGLVSAAFGFMRIIWQIGEPRGDHGR